MYWADIQLYCLFLKWYGHNWLIFNRVRRVLTIVSSQCPRSRVIYIARRHLFNQYLLRHYNSTQFQWLIVAKMYNVSGNDWLIFIQLYRFKHHLISMSDLFLKDEVWCWIVKGSNVTLSRAIPKALLWTGTKLSWNDMTDWYLLVRISIVSSVSSVSDLFLKKFVVLETINHTWLRICSYLLVIEHQ